jgi:hypothetical protein
LSGVEAVAARLRRRLEATLFLRAAAFSRFFRGEVKDCAEDEPLPLPPDLNPLTATDLQLLIALVLPVVLIWRHV